MRAVQRALWFIESHLAGDMTLDRVAAAACVSRYHMTRAFAAATGLSVMRYVRSRRLSIAAERLANGADDILAVALDAGYASHEAFTRAFREQFGCTPESVRAQGDIERNAFVEPIRMNEIADDKLQPPRLEEGASLLIAGLKARHACDKAAGIPGQWQRFSQFIGNVPGQIGNDAFGVIFNADDDGNIDYLCGVQVRNPDALPSGFETLRIAPQRYAAFTYTGHVANIRGAWSSIWNTALTDAGLEPIEAPCFERYGPSFNPDSGLGGFELWVPVRGT